MGRSRFFKRRFFVGELQYRLLAGHFFYLGSLVLLFCAVLYAPLMATLFDSSTPQDQTEVVAQQIVAMQGHVWVALPIIVVLCVLHSVLISHRIAGPLYRFNRIFNDLGRGDLSLRVRVRRTDYLIHEADALNTMIGSLAEKLRDIRESHTTACATLSDLMTSLQRGGQRDGQVLAGKLGTELDRLGEALRQFRIPVARNIPSPDMAEPGTKREYARTVL